MEPQRILEDGVLPDGYELVMLSGEVEYRGTGETLSLVVGPLIGPFGAAAVPPGTYALVLARKVDEPLVIVGPAILTGAGAAVLRRLNIDARRGDRFESHEAALAELGFKVVDPPAPPDPLEMMQRAWRESRDRLQKLAERHSRTDGNDTYEDGYLSGVIEGIAVMDAVAKTAGFWLEVIGTDGPGLEPE